MRSALLVLAFLCLATTPAVCADETASKPQAARDGDLSLPSAGSVEWPSVAAVQIRQNVELKVGVECLSAEYGDCNDDGSGSGGGGSCLSCYNPCMSNKACSVITGVGCYSQTYARCKNTGDKNHPCTSC